MESIMITADHQLIAQAREYAARRKTSLNALVCDWLTNLAQKKEEGSCWSKELEAAIETAQGNSHGQKWKREDLYRA